MNSVLQKKLNELQNANDYECWYLVKQPTAFDNLCYLVSFLKEFKTNDKALKYIDKLCSRYDLQVEEIINQDLEKTYVVDYYNQFSIKQLAI